MIDLVLTSLSAAFAFASGFAWIKAASISVPPPIPYLMDAKVSEQVAARSKKQSKWNGIAAWLAGGAAAFQGWGTIVHLISN
jgi:hypothetical protein